MSDDDPDALADALAASAAELASSLHPVISRLRRRGEVVPAGLPVAAVFTHEQGSPKPRHRAGRPSEALLVLAAEVAQRTRAAAGYADGDDNPALPALALACVYAAEARRSGALGLGEVAQAAPSAALLDPSVARLDPTVPAGAALLRVWAPVEGDERTTVELRFVPRD